MQLTKNIQLNIFFRFPTIRTCRIYRYNIQIQDRSDQTNNYVCSLYF